MKVVVIGLVATALGAQEAVKSVAPEAEVLKVNGKSYTRAQFEEFLKSQKGQDPGTRAARRAEGNTLARSLFLAGEARRLGLDKDPALQARLELFEAGLLSQALFRHVLEGVQKDPSLARRRYDSEQHFAEERRIRQILIHHTGSRPVAGKLSPEAALAKIEGLRRQLEAGSSFEELAKQHSDDTVTRDKGGDMDFHRRANLNPDFASVAFQLPKGELSRVIKTNEGYHLLRVEAIVPPAFELVRKSIEYQIANERFQAIAAQGVELNGDYFGQ